MDSTTASVEYFKAVEKQTELSWADGVGDAIEIGKRLSELRARTGKATVINMAAALRSQLEQGNLSMWKLYEVDGSVVTNERTFVSGGGENGSKYLIALSDDQKNVDIYRADATKPDLLELDSNESVLVEADRTTVNVNPRYPIEGKPISFPARGKALVAKDANLAFVVKSFSLQKPRPVTLV